MEAEEINSKALLEHKDKLVHVSYKIRGSNLNIITNDELALKRIFWKLKATFIGHNNTYRFVSIVTDTVKGHSLQLLHTDKHFILLNDF